MKRIKAVDQALYERVFWAADKLVDSGYMTIYSDTKDMIGSVLRENHGEPEEDTEWGEDPQQPAAPVIEVDWEYTTSPPSVNVCKSGMTNNEEVHGPFATSQMREWNRLGYFTTEQMWLRRVGQEWIFRRGQDLVELFALTNPENVPGA